VTDAPLARRGPAQGETAPGPRRGLSPARPRPPYPVLADHGGRV